MTKINGQNDITFLNKGKMFVNGTLYIDGGLQTEDNSAISQKGYTIITGNLVRKGTQSVVFSGSVSDEKDGVFEFRGKTSQLIAGTGNRIDNMVYFPGKLLINNKAANGTVTLMTNMSAKAQNIEVRSGRLIIDSEPGTGRETNNAYLLVEGNVTNGIQVNLSLGDNYKDGKLAGFTSPFEKLYADYFFYNFLSKPSNTGLFGDSKRLITNPYTMLKPGEGYIIGLGIIPEGDRYYTSSRDPRFNDADPSKRAKEMFRFSRAVAEPTFSKYMNETKAPGYITGEKLNTSDITLDIKKGFNYLGNPYTAPLDLSDIVSQSNMADWGVSNTTLKNGFYVLTNGQGKTSDNEKFTFTASYMKVQAVGGTSNERIVAPMQMFIVGSDTETKLKIPKSKRTLSKVVPFLRSTENKVVDEILIETKDNETEGYDRMCVVFRDNASLNADDMYDAPKIFNYSGGVNQIYMRSADDKNLSISIIPTKTNRITMYFEPAQQPQTVTLKAERLESLLTVSNVILEDKKTGSKINLLETPEYTFSSSPDDQSDRFVLHFNSNATSIESISSKELNASYNDGNILVYGLQNSDLGNTITVYNTQGQRLHSEQIRNIAPAGIRKQLQRGVYLLKINEKTTKLIVR